MKVWYIFLFMTYLITPMGTSNSGSETDLEAQQQLATILSYSYGHVKTKPNKGKDLGSTLPRSASSPELTDVTQLQNIACGIVLGSAQDTPTARAFKGKIKTLQENGDQDIQQIQRLSEDESNKPELERLVEQLFAKTLEVHQQAQQKKVKNAKIWSVGTGVIAVIPVMFALLQLFAIISVGVGCNT